MVDGLPFRCQDSIPRHSNINLGYETAVHMSLQCCSGTGRGECSKNVRSLAQVWLLNGNTVNDRVSRELRVECLRSWLTSHDKSEYLIYSETRSVQKNWLGAPDDGLIQRNLCSIHVLNFWLYKEPVLEIASLHSVNYFIDFLSKTYMNISRRCRGI